MTMGLAERRLLADFQQNFFETWKKEFFGIIGFEVPIDVKWDSVFFEVGTNYSKEALAENWGDVYFKTLSLTFSQICTDQMGKDAVKAGLKKIVIEGDHDTTNAEKTEFTDGMIIVRHKPFATSDTTAERAKTWRKMIEAKL